MVGNTMIDTLVAMQPRISAIDAPGRLGLEARRVPRRHAPPADARGRAAARRRDGGAAPRRRGAGRRPVHPRTRVARRARHRASARRPPAAARAARLPRVHEPGRGLGRRPHRLRRHPGGDDLPRHPVLHASHQHRAADHLRAGRTRCSASTPSGSPRCPSAAARPLRSGASRTTGTGRRRGIVDVLAASTPRSPRRGGEPPARAKRSRRRGAGHACPSRTTRPAACARARPACSGGDSGSARSCTTRTGHRISLIRSSMSHSSSPRLQSSYHAAPSGPSGGSKSRICSRVAGSRRTCPRSRSRSGRAPGACRP